MPRLLVLAAAVLFGTTGTAQAPPPGPMHLFSIEVTELLLLRPAGDHLDLDIWTQAGGTRRVERFSCS